MSTSAGKSRDTVSFRLAPEFMKLLEAEAAAAGEDRPNDAARRHVIRSLGNTGHEEVLHELRKLREEQRHLREDFATVALALLVKVGKEDPKKAEAWLREHLGS